VVTTRQTTFSIDSITFHSDGIQAMTPGVLGCRSEIFANDRSAKHLAS
jgi:hypothetical protein